MREHKRNLNEDVADSLIRSPLDETRRLFFGGRRRLTVIRQTEASECGLACLAMIAGFYGHHVDLASLRRRVSISLKGMTLGSLMEVAQTLGLICRPVRLELSELHQLDVPCILHWDMDHFVVLREVRGAWAVIIDPAVGERRLALKEVGQHFTGVAVAFSQGATFQRKPAEPPLSLRALAGSIHGLGRSLLQIFALALALEGFSLLAPQFMQLVVDQVLADGDHDLLVLLGISFSLLLLLQTAVTALRTWVVMWVGSHFNLGWTGNVFQHLLRLPQSYFLKRHLGDILSRFSAITTIQQTLTTHFVSVILDGIMASLTMVLLVIYSPLLAGITAVSVVIYAGIRMLYFRVFREANLNQVLVSAKQQTSLMESVRGIQTLRLHSQTAMQATRHLNATADVLNTSISIQRLGLIFSTLSGLTSGAQKIGVLWLGAWLCLRGQMSAGMLIAFVAYADQFTARADSLVDYLIQLRLLRVQGERLADIVMTAPEPHAEGLFVGPLPEVSIRFENVSFRYADGEPWILKGVSFEIAAGESVAITGPSGCGKSTLIKLLLGLLDPQVGTIRIGGVDLRHLGKDNYRKMLGCVMQDDHLFAGSIADNISFFDPSATLERIQRAAELASLHDDIVEMPMGYHSLVGDMGSSLSGGQQQRLHLARALYRRPKLLILDEATSHIDSMCEKDIFNAIRTEAMTKVVISHRHDVANLVDRVISFAREPRQGIDSKSPIAT